MINAIIQNQNGGTLVWEFPGSIYKLRGELEKIGVNLWPEQILLSDDEFNPVSVKLYSDNDLGNHMLLLFPGKDTLEDTENLTDIIANANELIEEELEQQILHNQYDTKENLYRNIRRMTYDAERFRKYFTFHLKEMFMTASIPNYCRFTSIFFSNMNMTSEMPCSFILGRILRIWLNTTTYRERKNCFLRIGM